MKDISHEASVPEGESRGQFFTADENILKGLLQYSPVQEIKKPGNKTFKITPVIFNV